MTDSLGQDKSVWTDEWKGRNPESEIRMWDYFGLRQWILKYVPRNGKVIEAGCGLGRYNFYLTRLGIDITGVDFSEETILFLKEWQRDNDYNIDFVQGNVLNLNLRDESVNGYISLGVIEHFIEGPERAIEEAFRVIKPGGIAIFSTPAPSWSKLYFRSITLVKRFVKEVLRIPANKKAFFQYEYSHWKLKNYIKEAGFHISRHSGADWLYTFTEIGRNSDKYVREGSFGYKISHLLENGCLSFLGAQAIVIAVKPGPEMHCFFCDKMDALMDSLKKYDVPVCPECVKNPNTHFYFKNNKVRFNRKYLIDPEITKTEIKCTKCGQIFESDLLFEKFGFDKDICPSCLKEPDVNIWLSNTSIQPIWRKRSS